MKLSFVLGIKTEWLKYKHTSLIWLTIVGAAVIPIMKIVTCMASDQLFDFMMLRYPWHFFLMINWHDTAAVILPMYIILLNNSIAQTEYKNNTWKQVYALPRTYADIYFSKLVVVQIMILFFFVCFNVFYLFGGAVVFLLKGMYGFTSFKIPWNQMLIISVRVYVGALAISAIQYWLSIRYRNFVVSIGTGLGLLLGSLLLGQWVKNHLYSPYLFALFMFLVDHSKEQLSLSSLYLISLTTCAMALLFGFLNIKSLQEKG